MKVGLLNELLNNIEFSFGFEDNALKICLLTRFDFNAIDKCRFQKLYKKLCRRISCNLP